MVESKIFRQVSLERLSSPEQLDLLMKITNPKGWLALFGVACLLAAVAVWAVIGRIPQEVNAPAVILPTGGIKSVISLSGGQVTALSVAPGDFVEVDQIIGEVTPLGQTTAVPITSPFNGRVIELKTGSGHLVEPGTIIASLEPAGENKTLEAIMYVSREEASRLETDMVVKLALQSSQVEEYGYLLGHIISIGDFPVSNQGVLSRVGNEDLAAFSLSQSLESPIEIKVSFLIDETTASGFKWTTSTGPNFAIGSGSLASAIIVVDQQSPLNLFIAR